jgi:hypothetical protein
MGMRVAHERLWVLAEEDVRVMLEVSTRKMRCSPVAELLREGFAQSVGLDCDLVLSGLARIQSLHVERRGDGGRWSLLGHSYSRSALSDEDSEVLVLLRGAEGVMVDFAREQHERQLLVLVHDAVLTQAG